ncbi:MAG: hypothetical protein ACT4N8_09535 [Sphingosinicella sp.]|uniref:hypothetical protein n=1 Tax=Sphingosinicella sp. TaxID=1917971 RepID=UPI0040381E7F
MRVYLITGVIAGAYVLFWPWSHTRRLLQRREDRLGELAAGEEESFFEERRELEAYPTMKSEWLLRLLGGVMFIGCLVLLLTGR